MHRPWFFFYGTLSEDHDNAVTRKLLPLLAGGRQADVRGALRAVRCADGWYPVLSAGTGRVKGRIYRARRHFGARELRWLDRYEDFDRRKPAQSEYVRRTVRVRIVGKGWVTALVYVYNRPCHPGLRVIPDGDFTAFQRRRRLRVFDPASRA